MKFFGSNLLLALIILILSIYSRKVLGIEDSALLAQFMNFGGGIALISTGRIEYLKRSNSFFGNLSLIGLFNSIIVSIIVAQLTGLNTVLLLFTSLILSFNSIYTEYFLREIKYNTILLSKYSIKTIIYSAIGILKSLSVGIYSGFIALILLSITSLRISYSLNIRRMYALAFFDIYRRKSIFIIVASASTWLPILLLNQSNRTEDIAFLGLIITLCGTPSNLLGNALRETLATLKIDQINGRLIKLFKVFTIISFLGFVLLIPWIEKFIELLISWILSDDWLKLSKLLPFALFFYSLNIVVHTLTFINFRYKKGTLERGYVILTILISLGFFFENFNLELFYLLRGFLAISYFYIHYKLNLL